MHYITCVSVNHALGFCEENFHRGQLAHTFLDHENRPVPLGAISRVKTPVSSLEGVLESSIKITNEPPTGMLANLHKALDNFTQVLSVFRNHGKIFMSSATVSIVAGCDSHAECRHAQIMLFSLLRWSITVVIFIGDPRNVLS